MKILITGGYGFIGSCIAERFYKEGHAIFIVDNLSTGSKDNINFPHKSWILDIESKKCEEIFKANKFDVVIHLAAQVEVGKSFLDPVQDTKQNVVGLINMLSLSSQYHVSKFVFASSAAVYGNDQYLPIAEDDQLAPLSPYGLNKMTGEFYCEKWNELFGLNTLILRFSNVYGPGQSIKGESGVISVFLNNLVNQQNMKVYGDGEQTRDFIYAGDVAEAIYRSVLSDLTGIYNLSSNTQNSLNQVIELLNQFSKVENVEYLEAKVGDIKDSCLDNTRLLRDIDWVPRFSIEDGLKKTYEWSKNRKEPETKSIEKIRKPLSLSFKGNVLLSYLENAGLFLLVTAISTILNESVFQANLFLTYIFVIGILFGKNQAFIAVMLSSFNLIAVHLQNGREFISLFTDYGILFQFAILLLVGLVTGYVIDRRRLREETLEAELGDLIEKYEFLEKIHSDTRQNKEELQHQIFHTEDSVGKVYSAVSALDSLESEDVIKGAVNVVEKLMNVKRVAVYLVNENQHYLRLAGKSGEGAFSVPNSISVTSHPVYEKLIHSKKVIMNKEWNPDSPILAAPVVKGDKVIAIINLYDSNFDYMTLHYQNLFTVITRLISAALTRGYEYESATYNSRYINGSRILKPELFRKMIDRKQQMLEEMNIPFSLLELPWNHGMKTLVEKAITQLRETDYIGSDESGKILILLSNSTEHELDFVISRLKEQGIIVNRIETEKAVQYA